MAQFAVYRNKNPRTKTAYIQSDLLGDLQTRVVIPLTKAAALARSTMERRRRATCSVTRASSLSERRLRVCSSRRV
jgi:hypothetical protein